MLEVKRTLVKSGPELWAEVADPAAVARHLSPFGSVRITRTDPEKLVEWEGDRARGAVRLEPSGFGTRVTLAADTRPRATSAPQPDPEPEPEPEPESSVEAAVREVAPELPRSVLARLFGRFTRRPAAEPAGPPEGSSDDAPDVAEEPAPEVEPLIADERALAILEEMLEALGQARHRPFSRA